MMHLEGHITAQWHTLHYIYYILYTIDAIESPCPSYKNPPDVTEEFLRTSRSIQPCNEAVVSMSINQFNHIC